MLYERLLLVTPPFRKNFFINLVSGLEPAIAVRGKAAAAKSAANGRKSAGPMWSMPAGRSSRPVKPLRSPVTSGWKGRSKDRNARRVAAAAVVGVAEAGVVENAEER